MCYESQHKFKLRPFCLWKRARRWDSSCLFQHLWRDVCEHLLRLTSKTPPDVLFLWCHCSLLWNFFIFFPLDEIQTYFLDVEYEYRTLYWLYCIFITYIIYAHIYYVFILYSYYNIEHFWHSNTSNREMNSFSKAHMLGSNRTRRSVYFLCHEISMTIYWFLLKHNLHVAASLCAEKLPVLRNIVWSLWLTAVSI